MRAYTRVHDACAWGTSAGRGRCGSSAVPCHRGASQAHHARLSAWCPEGPAQLLPCGAAASIRLTYVCQCGMDAVWHRVVVAWTRCGTDACAPEDACLPAAGFALPALTVVLRLDMPACTCNRQWAPHSAPQHATGNAGCLTQHQSAAAPTQSAAAPCRMTCAAEGVAQEHACCGAAHACLPPARAMLAPPTLCMSEQPGTTKGSHSSMHSTALLLGQDFGCESQHTRYKEMCAIPRHCSSACEVHESMRSFFVPWRHTPCTLHTPSAAGAHRNFRRPP
jgi:hypothetical protein